MTNFIKIILLVFSVFSLQACKEEIEVKLVRLGVADQPSSSLVHIALAKGYFKERGLEVDAVHFISGKRALLDGYVPGKVDYLTLADTPFAVASFTHEDIAALATIYSADNVNRIVARADRGIQDIQDIKGKTVATQGNSAVHYFLHSVLVLNNIDHDDLTLKFFKGSDLPGKLISGEIDAFSMREPYVSEAAVALGENAVVLDFPGAYIQSDILATRRSVLNKDPEVAKRLLAGLLDAQDFAIKNPDAAIGIVAKAISADPAYLAKSWGKFNIDVAMEQTLLFQLEKLANWIADEVQEGTQIPDFMKHLAPDPLRDVRPERVSLVGN